MLRVKRSGNVKFLVPPLTRKEQEALAAYRKRRQAEIKRKCRCCNPSF